MGGGMKKTLMFDGHNLGEEGTYRQVKARRFGFSMKVGARHDGSCFHPKAIDKWGPQARYTTH
jgi:hypothetical protein